MSDMKTVLNFAPYNKHTLKCTVSHDSFTHANGTLMYSFIKEGVLVYKENKSISYPGPFTELYTVTEMQEGILHYVCKVALLVNERMIDSAMSGTTLKLVGKCCIVFDCNIF